MVGPERLIERTIPDPRLKLCDAQRLALATVVEGGTDRQRRDIVRWQPWDLAAWQFERCGIGLDDSSVGRTVKRWIRPSCRPAASKDQRTASAAILGTIHPEMGKEGGGGGLVLPGRATQGMTAPLTGISRAVPILDSYESILDPGCEAGNRLVA